jgi:hypothetical protein
MLETSHCYQLVNFMLSGIHAKQQSSVLHVNPARTLTQPTLEPITNDLALQMG